MDLLFLGTSSGTPTRERNVSGIALIGASRRWYLVDCGEGTQHQLMRTPLSLQRLQAVFITHAHGDHCYGLPGLLGSAALGGRTTPLPIIAPQPVLDWLGQTLHLTAAHQTFALTLHALESFEQWHDDQVHVTATPLVHRVPSVAYRFSAPTGPARLDTARLVAEGVAAGPMWGRLQRGADVTLGNRIVHAADYLLPPAPPQRWVIAGDNQSPERLASACHDAQVLVHEATYTTDVAARLGTQVGHSAAAAVAAFAAAIGLPNLVLTHFSPRYQTGGPSPNIDDLRAEAAAIYSGRLFLAEDLARYRLDVKGRLTLLPAVAEH